MDIRTSLLDVAARLYAEHGWRGTTTRRIADAAGVNEVTVFRQFGTKASLMLEAIQHAASQELPTLPSKPRNLPAEIAAWSVANHALLRSRRGIILSCLAEFAERPEVGTDACRGGRAAIAALSTYLKIAAHHRLLSRPRLIDAGVHLLIRTVFFDALMRDMLPELRSRKPETVIAAQVEVLLRGLGATAYR